MKDFKDFQIMADLYFSYDAIFKYNEEPFSNDLIHIGNYGLFNSCLSIVNKLANFNSVHQLKGVIKNYHIDITIIFVFCFSIIDIFFCLFSMAMRLH